MIPRNKVELKDRKPIPTGSGTGKGYKVQARVNYREPKTILGTIYDNRWKDVPVYPSPLGVGVPPPSYKNTGAQLARLMDRVEAEAFRWLFLASAEAQDHVITICVETRILEYEVKYSYEAKVIAIIDAYDSRGQDVKEVSDEHVD